MNKMYLCINFTYWNLYNYRTQKLTAFFLNTYISMFNFEPNYDPFDSPSLPRGKNNIIIYINK